MEGFVIYVYLWGLQRIHHVRMVCGRLKRVGSIDQYTVTPRAWPDAFSYL